MSNQGRFILTFEESELLVFLEENQSIELTARAFGKDPSGVSRQLSRIREKFPSALEKVKGKWKITETGKKLNEQTRAAIKIQSDLLSFQTKIRIGTNREFAVRVLAPQLPKLVEELPYQVSISSFEGGTEQALLEGKIDIGIDCNRPYSPEIAYKLMVPEPIVAVASKAFLKKHKQQIASEGLYFSPHLACDRLYPDKIFSEEKNELNVIAEFNDVATTRSACLAGLGWALLPRYAVAQEVEAKQLYILREKNAGQGKYGVWWVRDRYKDTKAIQILSEWLREQVL